MTPPSRCDDLHVSIKRSSLQLPPSLRGAKRRGNPFSSQPLRGRAVLCTAGDTDCHGLRPRNDSVFWGVVLLLLPGQFSSLVGGVMTPPIRFDELHVSINRISLRLPPSLRGAKRRGNPFSSRPRRGRAVLCTAGDTDCHGLRPRNDSVFWGVVLLLLPGQLSGPVGGVMTPPYRSTTRLKKAPVSEETGAFHIAYRDAPPQPDHTCFTRVTISKICDSLAVGLTDLSAGRGRSRRRRPASRPQPR